MTRGARTERARARQSDPVTSHEAALEQRPAKVGAVQRVILDLLDHFGPLTDEQLVARFDEHVAAAEDAPPVTPQSVRTRRAELVLDGKVRAAGLSRSARGNRARTWTISDA